MFRALVLFDIDGTLLSTASAGRSAIECAFAEEYDDLGFFEQVRFGGKTDPQIVMELHAAAGFPERATPEGITKLLDRYLEYLEVSLAERRSKIQTMPGVNELLKALADERDVSVGLLTGNLVRGAKAKLAAARIEFEQFALGAYGSDSGHRPDLPAIAVERFRLASGYTPVGEEIVVVGDTPADVTCGASLGVRSVAVATGSYGQAELAAAGASYTFATLEPIDVVMEAILCPS